MTKKIKENVIILDTVELEEYLPFQIIKFRTHLCSTDAAEPDSQVKLFYSFWFNRNLSNEDIKTKPILEFREASYYQKCLLDFDTKKITLTESGVEGIVINVANIDDVIHHICLSLAGMEK